LNVQPEGYNPDIYEMNVLVATNMYPTEKYPFYGIFVKEQVESLKKEGVSVDVFFTNGKENRINYFTGIITLLKQLNSQHYDIIHAHHTYCIYLIVIVKTLLGIKTPVVLTFHEGEVHLSKELKLKTSDFIKKLVFSKRIKKFALKMVDLVITVQEGLVKALDFEGEYEILPCGVNTKLFKPMEKEWCRKRLKLPLDKKILFFPAAPQNQQKGFDILREALALLDRKDIYLLTAGNILHQDVPYYLNAADVMVQLSIFEASPSVLKEALAANVPVVITNVGDAVLIIKDVAGCFLCERTPQDVAEKIERALNFNECFKGRERIFEAGLTLEATSRRTISIYKELTESKGNSNNAKSLYS
jgi:glycosyltransferase involved in cell wall biosynthesis